MDLNLIEKYVDDGYVQKQSHPTLDLIIYTYSRKTQFDYHWDDVTTNTRGVIFNSKGDLIARPYPKFFNLSELKNKNIIPDLPYTIIEKMDGSLGIIFFYNNEWILATKGSFESEQAIKGNQLLKQKDLSKLNKDYTYLVEIISEESFICVKYDYEDLVLHGIIETKTGEEYDVLTSDLEDVFKYPRFFDYNLPINELFDTIETNMEGYVIKYQNNFRLKIKSDEYILIHRIKNNITPKRIINAYIEESDFESIILDLEEEYYDYYKKINNKLKQYFNDYKSDSINCYNKVVKRLPENFSSFEFYNKTKDLRNFNLVLSYKKHLLSQNKMYDIAIWKTIRDKKLF